MQLNLERFTVIRDTNAEMQFIDERLRFLVEVLAVRWVLLDEEIEQLREEAERGDLKAIEDRQRAERRVKRRAEREERDYRHIQKRYEREERKRAKEAVVCKEDGVNIMRDIGRKRKLAADDAESE
jgi:Skp family chaperone for outer membrane proteins